MADRYYFRSMRILRLITMITVLLPFLFSAAGILVIQSHCTCTGKNQVSLYLPPETCSTVLADHAHLFEFHAGDLAQCCHPETETHSSASCGHSGSCDCGCGDPDALFFQLDHEFTEEKPGLAKVMIFRILPETSSPVTRQDPCVTEFLNSSYTKAPPPLITAFNSFIHFICSPKIPSIA